MQAVSNGNSMDVQAVHDAQLAGTFSCGALAETELQMS